MARRALDMAAETGAEAVIWGGDFNMESRSRSMAAILDRGFEHVSGGDDQPSVVGYANIRVDHVLLHSAPGAPAVRTVSADVPAIPAQGICAGKRALIDLLAAWTTGCLRPHLHQMQDLRAVLRGEDGLAARAAAGVACLALSPVVFVLLALVMLHIWVHGYTRRAMWEWALREYGSDHLPVRVSLARGSGPITHRS